MALGNEQSGFFNGGSSGGSGGGVSSVGLTMPSAFNVTNTPITSSGDIAVTGAGSSSQYVRGDGVLANFPTSIGGGASVSYYLNGSVSQGTFGGSTYYQLSSTPITGAGTNFIRTNAQGNGLIAQFITDANVPNQINIPSGNWNFETYFSSSASGGTPSFYFEVYIYDGATFSLIGTNSTNPENISSGTITDLYISTVTIPSTSLALTDRIAIRVFVNTGGRTLTLHTEDANVCQIITSFTTGLTALNGLTAQVQTFATGTSGTDFNIQSSASTHTFNIPNASATDRGLLSSTDWTTFNDKQNALANPITGVGLSNNLTYFTNTNSIANLSTTTYPSLTEISYVKGVTSAIQTQIDNKPSNNSVVSAYQGLGSTVKAVPIGLNLSLNIATSQNLTNQRLFLMPVYLSTPTTITGVKWYQSTIGNYTANNYNGFGLYSVSGGTITLIASSTNDGNLWQTFSSGTWGNKAFSSPLSNQVAGTYFVAGVWNASATTTAPAIQHITSSIIAVQSFDFTGGRLASILPTQLTLPASITLSTTTGVATSFWLSLY